MVWPRSLMSYHRSHMPLGASYEEEMLALRRREVAAAEARARGDRWSRVWQALQAVAVAGIPVLTFLGVREWIAGKEAPRVRP